MTGSFERIEVITGVARRRRWSVGENLRIVAESLAASVRQILDRDPFWGICFCSAAAAGVV